MDKEENTFETALQKDNERWDRYWKKVDEMARKVFGVE